MTAIGPIAPISAVISIIKVPVFVRNVGPFVAILAIWAVLLLVMRKRD
jgi:hypothetical protein